MPRESQIPITSYEVSRRFAARLALFYGAVFGLIGVYLPFFPVWLQGVGIEPAWIGVILAAPPLTRFTVLPFITSMAERYHALRAAMILASLVTVLGFALIGTLREPLALLIAFALTACVWTPLVPLTDGYALKGVVRYGLNYGPLRLWGSGAFIVGAIGCGLVVDRIPVESLIWLIVAVAMLGALVSFGLQPLQGTSKPPAALARASRLLRDPGFLAIIAASALIQGSHAAYYSFASIAWQADGLAGLTIAGLWALGVIAEIVVFALSPRFTWSPVTLVMIGAASAVLRWSIMTQDLPLPLLATVQLLHGASFGITQVGIMTLMVRHVPHQFSASAQGYLIACAGLVTSVASVAAGALYARYGQGVYLMMAVMALGGGVLIALAQRRLQAAQPGGAR